MKLNFQAYAEDIAEVSNAATMELNIENGLKAIREVWKNTTYEMQHHHGDMYKIKSTDEVSQVCFFNIPSSIVTFFKEKEVLLGLAKCM